LTGFTYTYFDFYCSKAVLAVSFESVATTTQRRSALVTPWVNVGYIITTGTIVTDVCALTRVNLFTSFSPWGPPASPRISGYINDVNFFGLTETTSDNIHVFDLLSLTAGTAANASRSVAFCGYRIIPVDSSSPVYQFTVAST
jgi:hypothetical protein